MKITADMKIADVLKEYPSSRKVFEKYIPACVKCGGATAETIQRGAKMHGLDLDIFLTELNRSPIPRRKK
jgi:hybrid cluster-associated redox disulfide protein